MHVLLAAAPRIAEERRLYCMTMVYNGSLHGTAPMHAWTRALAPTVLGPHGAVQKRTYQLLPQFLSAQLPSATSALRARAAPAPHHCFAPRSHTQSPAQRTACLNQSASGAPPPLLACDAAAACGSGRRVGILDPRSVSWWRAFAADSHQACMSMTTRADTPRRQPIPFSSCRRASGNPAGAAVRVSGG